MTINNLIFNINYKGAVGQSTIVDHLITYSPETGCLPQQLEDIHKTPIYLHKENEDITRLPHINPDFHSIMRKDNFIDTLKESLKDFKDIERNPILESKFTFLLPNSIFPGSWKNNKEQRRFFVKQSGPYYVWDFNKRSRGKIIEQEIENFFDVETVEDLSPIEDIIIDLDKLLVGDKIASVNYYKYMCKQLSITSNLDLYDQFYDYFIDTDERTRLHMITNSDYITDLLHNGFKNRN